jgi:hypothetical protein
VPFSLPFPSVLGQGTLPASLHFPMMIAPEQPTLTLSEAAQALGVAPKTVRHRIKRGEIAADLVEGPHGPEYRVPASAIHGAGNGTATAAAAPASWAASPAGHPTADSLGRVGDRSLYPEPPDAVPLNGHRHELSPDAASTRAEAAERERDRLEEEVHFLRAQLHLAQSAGEVPFLRDRLEQAHRSEEQLRVLLGQAQRTIQAMAERPALPPAPEAPRRVRWWAPWRRG